MSKDAIKEIHEAEVKARQIVGDAEKESSLELERFKEELKVKYDEAVAKANEKKEEILLTAEKDSEERARPILDEAEREREKILSVSKDQFDNLVEDLVERIVK